MQKGKRQRVPSVLYNWHQPLRHWEATLKRMASIHETPRLAWYDLQVLAIAMLLRFAR
jgi:hypothetical protein